MGRRLGRALVLAVAASVAGPALPVDWATGAVRLADAPAAAVLAATEGTDPTTGTEPAASPDPASVVPPSPPACRYADVSASVDPEAAHLTFLDTAVSLKRAYVPPDLVPIPAGVIAGGGQIRRVVLPDLRALTRAAARDGIRFASVSAYRSYRTQISTFARWRTMVGDERVRLYSARPGHSEHQLGTTMDFATYGGGSPWRVRDWAKTPAGAWLAAHGWEYGFVMTYPRKGSPAVSCYAYEPWHWRWVGREAAAAIHDDGVVPRVWLWRRAATAR